MLVFDAFLSPEEAAELAKVAGHDFKPSAEGGQLGEVRVAFLPAPACICAAPARACAAPAAFVEPHCPPPIYISNARPHLSGRLPEGA